jgi:hypothetical protein
MDNEREIQEVRIGDQYIRERPGYRINIVINNMVKAAIESDAYGNKVKELWLGPGAFIVWKES